jgi:tetratricopeptide (TPR) repeat protein
MRIGAAGALAFAMFASAQGPGEIERAISLEQGGKADQAIAVLQTVLRRDPKSADAHNWLGVAYLQKNALAEAEREFRRAIELRPGFARAYNNLGSTLAQAGDILQGIKILEQGLRYAPDDFQLRLNLAMALRSKGDADAALERFRGLIREHGDEPELQYQYGQTLRQKGDLDGAVAAFERALSLNPEHTQASYALGQTLKQMAAGTSRSRQAIPADLLKAGNEALARGDFSAARQSAEKAIAADPKSPEAQYMLGFALWYAGDRNHATEALDESLRLNPAAANGYSFRGMTYRESGDLEQARRMLERAIALEPRRPLPYIDLAVVFLRLGKLDQALGQFEAGLNLPAAQRGLPDLNAAIGELRLAIARSPERADAHRTLGRLLGAAGADSSDVIAAFENAVRLRPDDAESFNAMGLVHVQAGNDEQAAAAFRKAIALQPEYADAHQNLGAVLATTDASQAVRELELAVKLQPAMLKAKYNLALAYEAVAEDGPARGIALLRDLLAAEPEYPRAEFALGRLLLRTGKVAEAVGHLERAVHQDPEFGEAHYQYGLALSRAGHRDEGTAEITKGRELITAGENRQAAALDLTAAKVALQKGDVTTASLKARKVLEFQPDSTEARSVLEASTPKPHSTADVDAIERLIRDRKFGEAEQSLRRRVEQQPESAWAWYALGYSLYGERKIGESIQALARSLQLDVNNADAHKVLGRDLMIIGRFDAAKTEFELGKKLNGKSAEMPYNLGKLYSIQDNWVDARREFEAALAIDPMYMEAYDGLGFAMEALGDDGAATANYRKSIELCEARRAAFASPYVNMSAVLNRSGDHASALEYARKAYATNPQSDRALFQMAKAYEQLEDLQAAADALKRAIELNPRASSYFYVLGTVYRKMGRSAESRDAMQSFARLERESNDLEQKRRDLLKEK